MHPPPDSTRPDTNSRRRPRATPPSRANVSETIGVLSGPRRAEPYENIYPPGGANSQGSYFAHHLHVTYGPSFIKDLFNSIGVFSAARIHLEADPEYACEPFCFRAPAGQAPGPSRTISIRRFCARPCGVSFGAIGCVSPKPLADKMFGLTPCDRR